VKRRIHYLINTKFQLAFTAKFALISTLFSAFIGFQLYAIVWPVISPFVPEQTMVFIKHQIIFRGILFLSLAALLIIVIAIVISHRVAGPIFSMERTIDKIVRGEKVEFVRLRKNDEFKGLAEKINGLITIIKELKAPPSTGNPPEK
jgi:signal transduction histidine kinase